MLAALPLVVLFGVCTYVNDGHGRGEAEPGQPTSRAARSAASTHGGAVHNDSDNRHWHLSWVSSGCRVDWMADGDVFYNKDGTDIARLSPGGMLTVIQQYGSHTRRLDFEQKDGMLDRKYMADGMVKPWDQYTADWLAELLVQVDHTTGALADVRFPKLMASGGPSAVMADLANATDNTKRMYLAKLTEASKLDPEESCQLAAMARHMTSDHDRAEVLIDAAGQIDFNSTACREQFFGAVKQHMTSDYDRSRVLLAALDHGPTSGPGLDGFTIAAINTVRYLSSDHEKGRVLASVAHRCSGSDSVRTAYLTAARTIASDAERARALTALVRQQ
jgi:hypothetical protein